MMPFLRMLWTVCSGGYPCPVCGKHVTGTSSGRTGRGQLMPKGTWVTFYEHRRGWCWGEKS